MERTDFEQWKSKEVARLLALVEAERRYYQEMVAALPMGVAVLSADRAILLANRSFRQTFGMRSEEIRRKTIEQILPSDELVEKIRSVHVEPDYAGAGSMTLEAAGKFFRVDVRPIRSWDEDMELETLVAIQEVSGSGALDISDGDAARRGAGGNNSRYSRSARDRVAGRYRNSEIYRGQRARQFRPGCSSLGVAADGGLFRRADSSGRPRSHDDPVSLRIGARRRGKRGVPYR